MRYRYVKIRHLFDMMQEPSFEYVVLDAKNNTFTARSFSEDTARTITAKLNADKHCKIIGVDTLLDIRRKMSETVVFTNGCFRIVHAGHAYLLEWAKQQGDILVVGVNTDASVYRIRGGGFCYPLAERMEILAALACVDYVVSFDDDTPYDLIEALKPDILVKGSECMYEYVPGSDLVSDVRIAPEGPYAHRHASGVLGMVDN